MTTKPGFFLLAIAVVLLGVGACGGTGSSSDSEPVDTSLPVTGIDLFKERVIGSNPGCITCHSLEPGVTLVGPSLAGIGDRAAGRAPGLTASEYLRQSIVDPDVYVVADFDSGMMLDNWTELLTAEQIDSLVEVLLGL